MYGKIVVKIKSLFCSARWKITPSSIKTDLICTRACALVDLIGVLVKAGLVATRSEGRRAIEQGGVAVDGEKVTDIKKEYEKADFEGGVIIKRGKKNFRKVVVK